MTTKLVPIQHQAAIAIADKLLEHLSEMKKNTAVVLELDAEETKVFIEFFDMLSALAEYAKHVAAAALENDAPVKP